MRVCIVPTYAGPDRGDGGIRRVVEAQQRYLPEFSIQVTDDPQAADLIACHGATLAERTSVPMVAHCHGMMWEDYGFGPWGGDVNRHVIDVLTRAQAITAPSQWVAHAITRGMLASPTVIYHGVDADAWAHHLDSLGYALWNKARVDPVSDPADMQQLAARMPDVPFLSTFGYATRNVHLLGALTYEDMRPYVQRAGVYLATARETMGIGTLEALAAGVPVAGWRYGGQAEIVVEGETGYLADYGDYDALADAVRRCLTERARLSPQCIDDAQTRWGWRDKIAQYAALYQDTHARWTETRPKVSVVVTTHNLARYLGDALQSVKAQTLTDWECLVVDDASTDDPQAVVTAEGDARCTLIRTPENLKLTGARNFGWQRARGRYVLFLDADDMLAPNALDQLATALDRHSEIHIAYGHLDIVNAYGEERRRNPWPGSSFDWRGQIAHLNQLPYAAMVRRAVLERSGGYRSRDWRAEDAALWTRLTSFGFRAAKVTDDSTLIYRLRGDSKSKGESGDGDWTAWLPWRLAPDAESGMRALETHAQPNPMIVPFGAQGTPPAPLKCWPVRHHQHPLVSVIIPVGPGHAAAVTDALDSVQAQTFVEWEAIVVNDTGDALDLTPWPWARLIDEYPGSAGAGAARNLGLRRARAPLVLFLDADDLLHPTALETMVRAYVASDGRYVYSDWATLADDGRWDSDVTARTVEDYSQRAMLAGLRHAVTALIPTEWVRSVGGFDAALKCFEDWDLYCKLAIMGMCGHRVSTPLLIYRQSLGARTRAALRPRASADDDTPRYTPLGEAEAAAIADRYHAYRSEEETCMGCCGGNQQTIAQASEALDAMVGFATGGAVPLTVAPEAIGPVRMEYIGDAWGAQTYIGKVSGLTYRAGRDPSDRFHNVDPRDAEHFVELGTFRIVPLEVLAAAAQAEPVATVAMEPRSEPTKRRYQQAARG